MSAMNIKKGDLVKVIAGKDKDKEGKVMVVDAKNGKLIVEGVNMMTKHTKPNAANQQGGIVTTEAPIDASNVMLVVDGKATRVGFKMEGDKKVRFAKSTGENTVTASMWFHIGSNMDQRTQVFIGTMTSTSLGLKELGTETVMSLAAPDDANRAIGTLDEALKKLNKQRADLGAYQNRFEMAAKGVNIAAENTQAAESRIRDTDMASEMVNFTKNQILTQSGAAMLAQANSQSQNVLALLS